MHPVQGLGGLVTYLLNMSVITIYILLCAKMNNLFYVLWTGMFLGLNQQTPLSNLHA